MSNVEILIDSFACRLSFVQPGVKYIFMTNRGGGHLAHRLIDTILLRQLLFAVAVACRGSLLLYWINVGINNDQQTKNLC